MAQARVQTRQEVSINGVFYRTKGQITQKLINQWAPKFVIGDMTKDSQQRASVWAPRFNRGIGKYRVRPGEESDKAWWSTLQIRGTHIVLPQLATTTAVGAAAQVGAIGTLSSEIYAAFGTDVRKYNNTTDSWGSSLDTLPAVPTDSITFRMNDVVYLAFATTSGYTYTSNGSSWVDDTTDTLYMAFWDDRLWGIDNTGQLWYSSQIGAESPGAQLPLPDGSVNDLFVARNADGVLVLFAATTVGLYAHDDLNNRWLYTELELPEHPDNGKGSTRWRNSVYIPAGLGIYQYIQGSNSAIATVVGPDLDDGLPSAQRGVVRQLIGTHNDLLAITDSTTAPGSRAMYVSRGMGTHHGVIIDPDVGYSSILGWNEAGWECKWIGGSSEEAITWAHVSFAYSEYRLWWAQNQRVYYMPLQRDIQNPQQNTTLTYASTEQELLTPWLEVSQESNGLALSLKVETLGCSSNETVDVDYALNYVESYTNLGTITSNGITEYLFPNSTAPAGTAFRSLQIRCRLVRGSTTTLTPDITGITLLYEKNLPPKYQFQADLDLTNAPDGNYKGQTNGQLRDALQVAKESSTLVEFTFRNDTDTDLGTADRRYYVKVYDSTDMQETGEDESGTSQVMLIEG